MTYSPDTVEQDVSAASALLTGDFLTYYKQFTNQVLIPNARQNRVAATASVVRAGVETLTSRKGDDPPLRRPNYD
jgi:Mce-associated membrane protein